METFDLQADLWHDSDSVSDDKVVKVIMRGRSAAVLPAHAFISILFENGVINENSFNNIRIIIQENNRKRYVFGKVKYSHRQTFSAFYEDEEISFLLIDPTEKRTLVTLIHMPVQTTEKAIEFIFKKLDNECDVSEVNIAPGDQMRYDRWQFMLDCKDKSKIPDAFVLPKMGIEGQDLIVKIFLEGRPRRRPSHHIDGTKVDNTHETVSDQLP